MKTIDCVIVHWNNPKALRETLSHLSLGAGVETTVILIDNSSEDNYLRQARGILEKSGFLFEIFVRENENREAGGYWHYISELLDKRKPDCVLFAQEELHQKGMVPKNVPAESLKDLLTTRFSFSINFLRQTKRFLENVSQVKRFGYFYKDNYRNDGLDLTRIVEYLADNPRDEIGLGGRRCSFLISEDSRFASGHWAEYNKKRGIVRYDFFSGACFAISYEMCRKLREGFVPDDADLRDPLFAWYWERMWGVAILLMGGRLVHYRNFSCNTIEEYSERNSEDSSFVSRSVSKDFDDIPKVDNRT